MAVVIGLLASTVGVLTGISPASAEITSPANGEVVRDASTNIVESRGGQRTGSAGGLCSASSVSSSIRVTRDSDSVVVLNQTKTGIGGFTAAWDLSGEQAGETFTIVSIANDRNRTSLFGSCALVTHTLSTINVTYRPWEFTFNDLLGKGSVSMNTIPTEVQATVTGTKSAILGEADSQIYYFTTVGGLLALPYDLTTCVVDPMSCVPDNAIPCDVGAGCIPQLAVVNAEKLRLNHVKGIFDFGSRAFAASVQADGKQRILASAGVTLDPVVQDLLSDVATAIDDMDIDALDILGSEIEIRTQDHGREFVTTVSLTEGLEMVSRVPQGQAQGTALNAPFTLNAGFFVHQVAAHSYPASEPDPSVMTVIESPLAPEMNVVVTGVVALAAAAAGLGLILAAPGPMVNIHYTYPDGSGSHTVGTSPLNGPSIDTAGNDVTGLPLSIPIPESSQTIADKGPMDFIGYAIIVDLPTFCVFGTCLDVGSFIIADGLATFGTNPLGAYSSLPLLWDTENPAGDQLNDLLGTTAPAVLANPAVATLLGATLALIGGGEPDVDAVAAVLSDIDNYQALLDAVSGGGLGAVPGLEDAIADLGLPAPASSPTTLVGSVLSLIGL